MAAVLSVISCTVQADPPEAFGVAGVAAPEIVKPAPVPHSTRLGIVIGGRVPTAQLGWEDNALLFADDVANPPSCKALRYGVGRDLKQPEGGGRWIAAADADGGWLWVMDVLSPSAKGLRLHLAGLNLPEGASVMVYDPANPEQLFGPYEGMGPVGDGEFWVPTVIGNTARVECHVPRMNGRPKGDPIKVDRVQHVYREVWKGAGEEQAEVGSCHNDVTCFSGWANTAKACGGIGSVSGADALYCSGQLLATTNGDQTPYYLTANHCLSTQSAATSGEFFWLFQTTTCNGAAPVLTSALRSTVATLVSTSATSDYTLLMIEGSLPAGLFFAGWTGTAASDGTAVACIHHPDGSWKRISFGNKASNTTCGGANHIRCNWTSAVTEGGSSGSGLFRTDTQQLIGQLHCGLSACGAVPANMNDDYGSFAVTAGAISGTLAAGADDALEQNDTCATARLMLTGTGWRQDAGLVVKKVDEDWYRYTVPTGATLTVSLAFTHANGDIDMQLFGTCGGGVLAQSITTTNAESVTIANAGAAQDYYVRVFLSGTDTRNGYTMTSTVLTPNTNDTCATPLVIGPGTYQGTTVGAAANYPSPCNTAATQNSPDLIFRFTAPAWNGTLTVDTCGSLYDTVLFVSTTCGQGNIACNDDSNTCGTNSLQSQFAIAATAGTTYYIRLGGYQGASGLWVMHVNYTAPPNNACGSATNIAAGAVAFDTRSATTDGPTETLCNAFGSSQVDNDVWYRYVPACTGFVDVGTCGASFDTRLTVYSAACPAASNTAIACNDDSSTCGGGSVSSFITFNGVAGQAYYIRVGGYNGAVGTGTLTVACRAGCAADIATEGNPSPNAGPDGFITGADFDLYVQCYYTEFRNAQNILVADITDGTGLGGPDGFVTGVDFDKFVQLYFTACQ